tara:strand:- start:280 stop:417 length:138 start_codon:yes stop_codon:yes gene_type:complete
MPNRKAKDRKFKKRKLNDWLKVNGRTSKQIKKRRKKNERKKSMLL